MKIGVNLLHLYCTLAQVVYYQWSGSRESNPRFGEITAPLKSRNVCTKTCIKMAKRDYLSDVLPKLGDWPITRIGELTPVAWKAAQKKS